MEEDTFGSGRAYFRGCPGDGNKDLAVLGRSSGKCRGGSGVRAGQAVSLAGKAVREKGCSECHALCFGCTGYFVHRRGLYYFAHLGCQYFRASHGERDCAEPAGRRVSHSHVRRICGGDFSHEGYPYRVSVSWRGAQLHPLLRKPFAPYHRKLQTI